MTTTFLGSGFIDSLIESMKPLIDDREPLIVDKNALIDDREPLIVDNNPLIEKGLTI